MIPRKQITIVIKDGPIVGTKVINLTKIDAEKSENKVGCEIHMKGLMSLFTFLIKEHILKGTDEAMERIANKAER